jgi:hypothetical protein
MPLDPVTQTLEMGRTPPGNSGGDGASGFVQMYLAAQQMQQRRREHADAVNFQQQKMDLENRQQQNQDTQSENNDLMAPLLREHQAAVNKQVGATAQGAVLDTQFKADSMEGLNQLTQIQLDSLKAEGGPLNPDIIQRSNDVITKYGLMRTQQGAAWMRETLDAKKVQDFYSIFGQPTSASAVDKESGATVNFGSKRESLAATQEIESLMSAAAANDKAQGITRTPAELAQRRLDFTQDKVLPMGSTETIKTPDGTEVTRVIGRQPAGGAKGGPTVAQANKAEDAATAASNAAASALDVIKYAETGNVGLIGNVNRLAATLGGQVADIKPGTEFKYAQATDFLKAAAVKVLRSDGNISEAERKQVIANLPSTSVNESPATAREKALNISHIMAESARRQVLRAGRPLPPELMTEVEIRNSMDRGDITRDQAKELLMKAPLSPFFGGPR